MQWSRCFLPSFKRRACPIDLDKSTPKYVWRYCTSFSSVTCVRGKKTFPCPHRRPYSSKNLTRVRRNATGCFPQRRAWRVHGYTDPLVVLVGIVRHVLRVVVQRASPATMEVWIYCICLCLLKFDGMAFLSFSKDMFVYSLTNEKRRPSVIVVGHDSNHRKTHTEFLQVMITSPVSNQCAPPTRRGIGLLLSSEAETWFSKGCTRTCTATAPSEQRAPSEIFTWNCYNFSQSLASWHRSGNIQDCLNPPKSSFSQSSL